MIEIRVVPTYEVFFNEENFFGIYRCDVHPDSAKELRDNNWKLSAYGNISFKGVSPRLNIGEEYLVTIKEDSQSTYVGSYILENLRQEKPVTLEQQRIFLESLLTEKQVSNIFEVYNEGQDIVAMIENNEFDYSKVHGLGEKTYVKLHNKVVENIVLSDLLVFLSKYGIKYNMISNLVKEFKNPQIVIEKIEENPYLLTKVKGIGFKKADAIAKAVGYSMTSPHRIDSCIKYTIGEENSNGHSWIGKKQLFDKCIELLNIEKQYIERRLNAVPDGIICSNDRYTTEDVIEAEKYISMKMTQFKAQSKMLFTTEELDKFINEYCEKNNVELEENQRKFFYDWNENNILFLVGGGGMGKSWLQKILLDLIDTKNLRTALLSPTGKASKVQSNYTGRPASTIHRKAGVFDNEEEANNEITEDVIIVDESSMCDVFILAKLFKAIINNNARILFVGDDFQLPSVGVGNFLYDSINSNCVKISKLKKVFRQADGGILNVATDIREGKQFLNDTDEGRMQFGRDCVFWLVDQKYVRDGVIHNYKNVLKKFSPDDVIILSPTKKGKLGTAEINKEIQEIVNPASSTKKEKTFGRDFPITIRVGDSVMNTVNTYQIETVNGGTADIFNGDTGKIVDIDEEEKLVIVDFEGIVVKMKFESVLTSLLHSWCMTIHKSQGSQFKVVIVIIDKSMKYQLNANLLYTGISRAKHYMLGIGQAETINYAMKKFANMERKSFMQEFLSTYNGIESLTKEDYAV